ncbi:MAG: hypothetical protein ACXWKG_10855, partial [Limisphaerales bacterium]
MANQLLDRKLGHIKTTKAPIVASANPGCLAHMVNGVRRHEMPVRLVHPITLLAEAYRGE